MKKEKRWFNLTLNCIRVRLGGRGYHGTQHLVFRLLHFNAVIFLADNFCNFPKYIGFCCFGEKKMRSAASFSRYKHDKWDFFLLFLSVPEYQSGYSLIWTGGCVQIVNKRKVLTWHHAKLHLQYEPCNSLQVPIWPETNISLRIWHC